MKKLSYLFVLLLFTGVIFTSCSDDKTEEPQDLKPAISFQSGGDFINTDVVIDQGDSIQVGVICTANATSGKKLESFKIYMIINNVTQPSIVEVNNIDASGFTQAYSITFDDVLTGKLYAEITDKDGQKNSESFNVTVEEAVTPLGAEQALTWERVAGAAATGLDMFGLKWTSNGKEVMAEIKKADAGAEKFVQLTADQWAALATVEDLAAAVEAGTDMSVYKGISAEAPDDYNEVLATKYNDEYFLIHLTHAGIVVNVGGTTITITGHYKK